MQTNENHGPAPVLVALSGRETSLGALRTAARIARRQGGGVELVAVFEPRFPLPVAPVEGELPRVDDPWQRHEAHALVERIRAERERMRDEFPEAEHWPIHLEVGDAPAKLARAARHSGAAMIVVGLGRQGDPAGPQVARRLLYLSSVPVLAVPAEASGELASAVVDVGLCATSVRVARAAMRLLPEGGELHLVSVTPGTGRAVPGVGEEGSDLLLTDPEALRRQLGAPPRLVVRTARLDGDPASQVLSYAEQLHIPLLATAIEGRSPTERTLLRNMGPALLRERRSAVLLVPPVEPRSWALPEPVETMPATGWARPGAVSRW